MQSLGRSVKGAGINGLEILVEPVVEEGNKKNTGEIDRWSQPANIGVHGTQVTKKLQILKMPG